MTKVKIQPEDVTEEAVSLLKYSDYADYFKALLINNSAFIESFMADLKPAERKRVVNSEFDLKNVECPYLRKEESHRDVAITLPLHIAVTNHSLDVARMLIKHGANVLQADSEGNNVVHACVTSAFYAPPEAEQDMCATLGAFTNDLHPSLVLQLMKRENKQKFRPLEYAVQQETLLLMRHIIFTTENYLIVKTIDHGMTSYDWYDVTEYEYERHFRSPMLLLTFLSYAKANETVPSLLKCPLFGSWIRAKFRINLIPIIVWFLLRSVVLFTYFSVDRADLWLQEMEEGNPGNITFCHGDTVPLTRGQYYSIVSFLFIFTSISILFDVVEIIYIVINKSYVMMRTLKGWKETMVNFFFYRMCTFLVSISILVANAVFIRYDSVADVTESDYLIISLFRTIVPLCACWSLMYFLQMLPYLGKSIVAIQGMLLDMANFMVIWVLIILPFAHTFQIFITYNSQEGCIEDFRDMWATLYSLFRMMLNMIDLTQYNLRLIVVIEIMHIAYVLLVAIVLINFLIAIMSASAARIGEHDLAIQWLSSLAVAVTVQGRFGRWLLKPYYRYMAKRVFATDSEGRLFVVIHGNHRQSLIERKHVRNV